MKFGIIPELIGRLPVVTALEALDVDALIRILHEPKNALIKQYKYLFNADGIDLEFQPEALRAIAKKSIERNTGARGLRSIVEQTLRDIMFTAPSDDTITKITITADCVEGKGEPEIEHGKSNKKPAKKAEDESMNKEKTIKDNEVISKREGMTKKEMIENHLDTLFYDVSNDALKQEIKDTHNSFIRFFKKVSKYPVKKSYQSYKKSYYADPYKIEFSDKKVKLEKIANNQKENRRVLNLISLAEKNRIPTNAIYYNPRVVLEGNKFYIVVSVDDEYAPKKKKELNKDKTIGIDVNIKSIVTSDNSVYETITKKENYKKAKKKYVRT